jgi:hypothetical protein
MTGKLVLMLALVSTGVVACSDSKPRGSDSALGGAQTEAQRVDVIQLDTNAVQPPAPGASGAPSAPPVIGESRRDASPTARPPASGDPMPPAAGETNMRHGTMKPAEPILRDSASGPRQKIDRTGQRIPIKK